MGLFNRRAARQAPPTGSAVGDFWSWWRASGEARLSEVLQLSRVPDDLVADIARRVDAVHPGLDWELGPGSTAEHTFCISAKGDPELRPFAERWLRAAPAPSPTWEFIAARRGSRLDGSRLEFRGVPVDLSLTRVAVTVDDERQRIDVVVTNPAFDALGTDAALQVSFLTLDWSLGEDEVERWIGTVSSSTESLDATVSIDDLPAIVSALDERHPQPTWVLLEASGADDERVVAVMRHPLRWIDHPMCDLHSEIGFDYADARPDGLPESDASARLSDLANRIHAELGSRAEVVGHVTSAGRRAFHIYSDGEDQNVRDLIDRFAASWQGNVIHERDPGWRAVRHLS